MDLNEREKRIWEKVSTALAEERVASPDHVARMTAWCQKLGPDQGADMEALVAGALVHDLGVLTDRKNHYLAGKPAAAAILGEEGLAPEMVTKALKVMESHSRYGGPKPETTEAKVGQDSDALEYLGAIGLVRAVVRGLTDGSYNGRTSDFPAYLRTLLGKLEGSFHYDSAREIGTGRIEYMRRFLDRLERELEGEL